MNKRVLLIEDQEEYQIIIGTKLKQFNGVEMMKATDGAQGLEIAQRIKPDLILCDIGLPTMDGFEIMKELSKSPTTSNIPFIILSAYDDNAHMVKAVERGALNYLSKPFSGDELVETIEHSLPEFFEAA